MRVPRHRNKILDLKFTDRYLTGKEMPCNYASRHPMLLKGLSQKERERLLIDEGEDIQVMRLFFNNLPPSLSLEMVQEVASGYQNYQILKKAVQAGKKPNDRDMVQNMSVCTELGVIKGLVCRGEKVLIPEGRHTRYNVPLREWVVNLGHSAHHGMDAIKRQLRVRLWFPGMERMVEKEVEGCLPCLASVESHNRDPSNPAWHQRTEEP